jgi:DNA-binding GntR family transcriptional regulator
VDTATVRFVEPGLIRDRIVDALRDAIVSGRLRPGDRISERELVVSMGVSRSPLREAIRVLEGEGLLATVPHRGARVTEMSVEDLRHTSEVRIMLETFAVRRLGGHSQWAGLEALAAQIRRVDAPAPDRPPGVELDYSMSFHDAIITASGNPRVIQHFQIVKQHLRRYQLLAFSRLNRAERANEEHAEILEALERRDLALVERRLTEHITRGSDEIAAHLEVGTLTIGSNPHSLTSRSKT